MKKILAVWAAKLATVAGKLIGKKSSSSPGVIALKICPDIIKILTKNIEKDIIVTCGTNGKTTTNNLLYTTLTKSGHRVVCNNLGANMLSGVATTLAQSCNIFGKFKADYACFEIDEAAAVRVFDHLTPDYMVVTNLFRDQLDRYGEIDTTFKLLTKAIEKAPNVKLILNGDDPLTSQLGKVASARYFGIDEKVLPQLNETKEGRYCTACGNEMSYNYFHYSQLGDFYCTECGIKRPELDYAAREVDLKNSLKFKINDTDIIDVNYRGFYNIYNILAVYSAFDMLGIDKNKFSEMLDDYKPQIGRMEEFDIGKPVILNLAKNPAGFNQAIQTVLQDPRKKDIIIAINDKVNDGQDVSWLWDVDFERLKDSEMNTLTASGIRLYDLALRFKYSDVLVDSVTSDMRSAVLSTLDTDAEVCYVLVNYTALFSTQTILVELADKRKKELDGKGEN